MSLVIIAAKNIEHSYSLNRKEIEGCYSVVESEGLGKFLYDYKNLLLNYDYYYRFDPYDITYLEKDNVEKIEIFANSISQLIKNENIEENYIIEKYNVSTKKVIKFAQSLLKICLFAKKNHYGLVWQGD